MRKIKFRLWDSKNNSWYEPTFEAYRGKVEEVMISPQGRLTMRTMTEFVDESMFPDRFELMQFTGLHDKDGREIYEGDLFEHKFGYMVFDDAPHDEMGTECGVVVLEDGQFGVKIPGLGVYNLYDLLLREGHLDNMPKGDLFVMKIAGNIYENPELLEVTKHE